jgi:gamma-glutamyltranspeptidase/glutathione hydrolase
MRTRATALASEPFVEEAARRELAQSKSAVAAVVAGFFAAAGRHADVLLGPTTLLVAGVGSGGRIFDGRLRQPGLGTKRPRGFREGEAIPDAARVALPSTVAALAVALAYDRVATLTSVARPGVLAAAEAESEGRKRLLERIAAVGPRALAESAFVRPLLHLASPSEGGLLTPADFVGSGEFAVPASERKTRGQTLLEAPWSHEKPRGPAPLLGEGLCAVDARGVYAALGYARIGEGLAVDALGLVAALAATPVERGTPRVRPGQPIACNAPFSVSLDEAGVPEEVSLSARAKKRARVLRIARDTGRWVLAKR